MDGDVGPGAFAGVAAPEHRGIDYNIGIYDQGRRHQETVGTPVNG